MKFSFKVWIGNWEFMGKRLGVYASLRDEFGDGGSRRNKTLRETFDRWAKRETSRKNACGYIFEAIAKSLADGRTFADSVRPFVPKEESMIIESGEASGKIVESFKSVTRQAEADQEIKKTMRQGMSDPLVGVVSFLIVSIVCGMKVWPPLLSAIDEKYWPTWVWPMVNAQISLAAWWPHYLAGLIGFICFIVWSLPNLTGRIRTVLDYIPPYTIYRLRQSSALLGVMGGLLNAGMEMSAAFKRVADISNPYMRWHIRKILKKMESSGSDGIKSLDVGLFNMVIMDRIEDASASRGFDETLTYIGTTALDSVIDRVKGAVAAFVATLVAVNGLCMLYFTAVQVIGIQIALNEFMAAQGG